MDSDRNLNEELKDNSTRQTLVDKLTKEIEANLNNDQFGVDSLAQAIGMSRSSLHRKLHRLLGISTSQFIREFRLKRALEILKKEDITVSETAYRVGFSSATYFSTCFNKFYGFTPGEVKSRNSEEIEKLVHTENDSIRKNRTKKRVFWAILFAVSVLTAASYFYNLDVRAKATSNDSKSIINGKSIAVLPLKNLTGNDDLEYLSDGMTDAIISRLAKISTIDKVIPFTSTLSYKETDKTIEKIVAELGVSNLLQGNLQISGNQIKISLQLIDATTYEHNWSEEYTRDWKSDEVFKMQAEVVEGIANHMNANIAEIELVDIQKIPTKNKQAYMYFLQAEFQRHKSNTQAYANAISLYDKVIALDSNFVDAYRGQATVWSFGGLVWGIYDQRTAWSNAKKLLEKALEIDPDNKEVEEELYTGYFYYDWNFEEVERYYQQILEVSYLDNTPAINADYAIKTGRYQNTIDAMDEIILTEPSIGVLYYFKARALMSLGKIQEASDLLNSTYSLYNDNWFYLRESAKFNYYLKDYEKSKTQLKKILTQFPDYPPILMWLNAVYAQMDGNSKEAIRYLAELQNEYNKGSSGSPAWFIALYYSHIKDYEKTFEWLQKAYDRHDVELTWLREEPLLAPIRNDSRYKDLYDKVGFSSIGLPIKPPAEIYSSK